jgi:hypothetical protein
VKTKVTVPEGNAATRSGLQLGDDARDRVVGEGDRFVIGHGRALGAQRFETLRRESFFDVRPRDLVRGNGVRRVAELRRARR